MQLDDLKNQMKKEIAMQQTLTDFAKIRRNIDAFDHRAKVSWAIELFVCAGIVTVVCLAWFVFLPFKELHPLFHLGMLVMIVSVVFVAGKIIVARKTSTENDWTLAAKLNIQIEKREKEIKLLTSVATWYLSPLLLAVLLASYGGFVQRTGTYIPDVGLWLYWVACLIFYAGIYFYNQRKAKTIIQPILNQLYSLKRELEN